MIHLMESRENGVPTRLLLILAIEPHSGWSCVWKTQLSKPLGALHAHWPLGTEFPTLLATRCRVQSLDCGLTDSG